MVVLGLFAAFSPTVLVATLAVLGSGRGRLNGIVFVIAFLVGQSLAFLVGFLVGSAVTPDHGSNRTRAIVELAAGIMLVVVAWRRRSASGCDARTTSRSDALFARLSRVKPAVSFGVGMPLGVGARRLVFTLLAATSVAAAELSSAEEVSLGFLYIAIASVVVWVPVLLYLVFGDRADGAMEDTKRWIATHEEQFIVVSALVIGVLLLVSGLVNLLQAAAGE